MRLNTLLEQHDLIDAEAAGKRIEYYFLNHPTPIRTKNMKGRWSFEDTFYFMYVEPATPQVEEYEIKRDAKHSYYFSIMQDDIRISHAADYGFVFVHENGKEYNDLIMWTNPQGHYFHSSGQDRKPVAAKRVRRVL